MKELCLKHGVRTESLLAKISSDVEIAWMAAVRSKSRGMVYCGRTWRGQRREDIPYRVDTIAISASKGKGQIGNALSPFNLYVPDDMMRWATVDGKPDGMPLPLPQQLELVWQSAKKAADEDWSQYFSRRERIYKKQTPKRRYLERGATIAGACFGGDLVEYIPSRVFYCTAYERAIRTTAEFGLLKALVDAGFNLLLLGPDGYPLEGSLEGAYNDSSVPFGHERVLVAMLREEMPWKDAAPCW